MNSTAKALIDTTDETMAQWNAFLASIASGAAPTEAMQLHGILWREVESVVLTSQIEGQRWREAKLLGTASRWSLLERDELFAKISAGIAVEQAILAVRGSENAERDFADVFQLIEALPQWQDLYSSAMRACGLREERQIIEIADDTSRDTLPSKHGDIPNMAAVSRAKLRAEVRQWRLAKLDPQRWGEKRDNVQINIQVNHAERLEEARTRSRVRDAGQVTQQQMREAVDAVFKPATVEAAPAVEQAAESEQHSCLDE